jgi:predicted nuclease of predicted toxin-antitoxin system
VSFVYFTDRDLGLRFPKILTDAGLTVERHRDHFKHDARDEEWLQVVGRRGWVAVTHNSRIRYTPNEKEAVIRHRVRLLIVIGHAPYPDLARSFVATTPQIETFLETHVPPMIAKVYRGPDVEAPGRIELWYPESRK